MRAAGWLGVIALHALAAAPAAAQAPKAKTVDELLKMVKTGAREESAELKARERAFIAAKNNQAKLLADAQAVLARAQKRGEALETEFASNEGLIAELEETLRLRLGNMGELFGVIRQVAGDTRAQITGSMISSEYPNREPVLEELAQSQSLPSIPQLEQLWYILQQEMTEQGKVTRYTATVATGDGTNEEQEVVRLGVFNAYSGNKFLVWNVEERKLSELGRQPEARYRDDVRRLTGSSSGLVRSVIDPSRGVILSMLVETPTWRERIDLGGPVGYTVIVLGLLAALLGIVRLVYLFLQDMSVRSQLRSPNQPRNNPLGRILRVYHDNPDSDTETMERKLDEGIIRESARLERYLWIVKVIAVAAPLMGLLGTVTGMIETFQSITLFGTGDPKLMASGISEALVTTMLGLITAIPLVMLHAALTAVSRRTVEVLEEQAAGLVARRVEERERSGGAGV